MCVCVNLLLQTSPNRSAVNVESRASPWKHLSVCGGGRCVFSGECVGVSVSELRGCSETH